MPFSRRLRTRILQIDTTVSEHGVVSYSPISPVLIRGGTHRYIGGDDLRLYGAFAPPNSTPQDKCTSRAKYSAWRLVFLRAGRVLPTGSYALACSPRCPASRCVALMNVVSQRR